jgi:opacity protein-like surface antigen
VLDEESFNKFSAFFEPDRTVIPIRGYRLAHLAFPGHVALALSFIPAFLVAPAEAQIAVPTGIYVRGELGGAFHQNVVFRDTQPDAVNCDLCAMSFPSSVGSSAIIGGGLGYRLTPNFRVELSLDYLTPAKVTGHDSATPPSTASVNLDSFVALVNGYVDFPELPPGLFGSVQPYVDAGIGLASNSLGLTRGNSGTVGPFTIAGASQTNFAYALGIGAGFPLTPRLTADLAYRFIDLGQLRTGSTLSAGGASFQVTASRTGSSDAHTITIGLRYQF